MSEERTLYESETQRTIPQVIDFLRQLSFWLGDRRLAFEEDGETVIVEIPNEVVLEIEIEEEDEGENQVKRSLEIEIEWVEEKARASAAGSGNEAESAANAVAAVADEEE